jgi:hypothetical protein
MIDKTTRTILISDDDGRESIRITMGWCFWNGDKKVNVIKKKVSHFFSKKLASSTCTILLLCKQDPTSQETTKNRLFLVGPLLRFENTGTVATSSSRILFHHHHDSS